MAAIPQKIGFYSLRKSAQQFCNFYVKFFPLIQQFFADKPLLLSALTLANDACAEVVKQIDLNETPGV